MNQLLGPLPNEISRVRLDEWTDLHRLHKHRQGDERGEGRGFDPRSHRCRWLGEVESRRPPIVFVNIFERDTFIRTTSSYTAMIRAARALSRRARALQNASNAALPYYDRVDLDPAQGGERALLQHTLHPSRSWNIDNKRRFA